VSLVCRSCTEREKASADTRRDVHMGQLAPGPGRGSVPRQKPKALSTVAAPLADRLVVAVKPLLAGVGAEPRGRLT
jgi:hypothetical protein